MYNIHGRQLPPNILFLLLFRTLIFSRACCHQSKWWQLPLVRSGHMTLFPSTPCSQVWPLRCIQKCWEIWGKKLFIRKGVNFTSHLLLSSTAGLEHRHDGWSSSSYFSHLRSKIFCPTSYRIVGQKIKSFGTWRHHGTTITALNCLLLDFFYLKMNKRMNEWASSLFQLCLFYFVPYVHSNSSLHVGDLSQSSLSLPSSRSIAYGSLKHMRINLWLIYESPKPSPRYPWIPEHVSS